MNRRGKTCGRDTASTNSRQRGWRVLLAAVGVGGVYFLSAGPVTRYAPEFADWLYAPLGLVAEIPLAGSVLRGWLLLWGVDGG